MRLFLSAALLAICTGCPTTSGDDSGGNNGDGLADCRAEDGDEYNVDDVSLSGDTLTVTVSHGGGCEEHEYELCWPDHLFMESNPVQVNLEVWHNANGDTCEALLTEVLEFDLTPLKDEWIEGYGQSTGTITIHIGGSTVDYTF